MLAHHHVGHIEHLVTFVERGFHIFEGGKELFYDGGGFFHGCLIFFSWVFVVHFFLSRCIRMQEREKGLMLLFCPSDTLMTMHDGSSFFLSIYFCRRLR